MASRRRPAKKKAAKSLRKSTKKKSSRRGKGKKRKKASKNRFIGWFLSLLALGAVTALMLKGPELGGGEGPMIEVSVLSTLGESGVGEGQLKDPRGLLVSDSRVIISDIGRNRVLIFSRQGRFLNEIDGSQGAKSIGPLNTPYGLVWGLDKKTFWVSQSWNPGAIREFDMKGNQLRAFAGKKYGFYGPRGLGGVNNLLLVADTGRHQIAVIDLKGRLLKLIGSQADGTSFFLDPTDVVGLADGLFAVVDRGHHLSFWNISGEMLSSVKIPRARNFGESPEHGVAVSPKGLVAVTDPQARRVYIFDPKGKTLGWITNLDADGKLSLEYPTGLAFVGEKSLAVADGFHDKVFILELTGL